MTGSALLERARQEAGLTQEELAARAHTSRPTLSAYEHGRKSPRLDTAERLLEETGHRLAIEPRVEFRKHQTRRGAVQVPTRLPRLPVREALATVELPLHLNWSNPGRTFDMSRRTERERVYEIVLREGEPADVLKYVDGALLVEMWPDLVLPRDIREAWDPVVRSELAGDSAAAA